MSEIFNRYRSLTHLQELEYICLYFIQLFVSFNVQSPEEKEFHPVRIIRQTILDHTDHISKTIYVFLL